MLKTMNKNNKENSQDTLKEFLTGNTRGITRTLEDGTTQHEFPITGAIEGVEEYDDLINALRGAGSEDVVLITINTPGGDLMTAQVLVDEIDACEGIVIAKVAGQASSAGSIIALACDVLLATDNSYWLLHTISYGVENNAYEIEHQVKFDSELARRVAKQHYGDFLPQDKLDALLKGQQLFMFGDEIMALWNIRKQKYDQQYEEQKEQYKNEQFEELTEEDLKDVLKRAKIALKKKST